MIIFSTIVETLIEFVDKFHRAIVHKCVRFLSATTRIKIKMAIRNGMFNDRLFLSKELDRKIEMLAYINGICINEILISI